MKMSLLLLLSCLSLQAQPRLTVAVTNEFDTGSEFITGLTGLGGLSSLHISEVPPIPFLLMTGDLAPKLGLIRRVMWFNLLIANTGDEDFDPGNFPLTMTFWRKIGLNGLASAAVSDSNGNILRERLISSGFAFDTIPFWQDTGMVCLPPFRSRFFYGNFGLSRRWMMWDEQFVEVTGLADGDYTLTITVDPVGLWWLTDSVSIRFSLHGTDAVLR